MDEERKEFGFCPKCGAVMQNGVCQSCGYGGRKDSFSERPGSSAGREKKTMSAGKKILVGAGIVLGVLAILMVIIFLAGSVIFGISGVRSSSSGDYSDGFDRYYDYYNGSGGYSQGNGYDGTYVPDENDPYYEEITDAIPEEQSHMIIWKSSSMYSDDADNSCSYDCVYPVLTGDAGEDYSAVNARIQQLAGKYEAVYQDYAGGVTSTGYVTYMDEEKYSVVILHRLYTEQGTLPRIDAVSYDLKTGEEIPCSDMTEVDQELVKQFRSRNTYQNGEIDFVEEASDEELLELLRDPEKCVMFYTPVGLEIGFNYEGDNPGWVTVTLKKKVV